MKPRQRLNVPVLGSLIDRLGEDTERVGDAGLTLSMLRDGLRRDLEGLLNTRRRFLSWPEELEELDRSLVNYGLADFTNAAISSEEFRADFILEVESLILRLEPRIQQFEVSILETDEVTDRTIRFRIMGYVNFGGEHQHVSFDSQVDPVRCGVVMRD